MKEEKQEHYMIREINEQPGVIRSLIDRYFDFENKQVKKLDGLKAQASKIKRFTFIGNGSSGYAAMLGNYLFEEIVGLPCEHEFADEFIARKKVIEPGTAVVVISQSGETADIIEAVLQAKKSKVYIIGLTNNPSSELAKLVDFTLQTDAGKEVAIASTKTFTTQLLMLIVLALYLAKRNGKNIAERIYNEINSIPELMSQLLKSSENTVRKLAKSLKGKDDILVMGRKYNYPIALEGAQKLKETDYLHAEGFAAEEFRHGPKAIIKEAYPVILLMPIDSVYAGNKRLASHLKKAGARITAITNKTDVELETMADETIEIPETLEVLCSFLMVIPLQLLAYYTALEKGIDPDNPRNLEKYIK
jgi:glucosamine--fructose-6-phosphate aminotransferase (isomerizing)